MYMYVYIIQFKWTRNLSVLFGRIKIHKTGRDACRGYVRTGTGTGST